MLSWEGGQRKAASRQGGMQGGGQTRCATFIFSSAPSAAFGFARQPARPLATVTAVASLSVLPDDFAARFDFS